MCCSIVFDHRMQLGTLALWLETRWLPMFAVFPPGGVLITVLVDCVIQACI